MYRPSKNPSILQPLTEHHPPLPTISTLPVAQEKDDPPPLPQFSLLSVFFQQTTGARRCVPTLAGWGATPGNRRAGISLPAPWPGRRAPRRRQRGKGVCAQQAAGSKGGQAPSPRDVGARWVPAPGATRRAMLRKMMVPLWGEQGTVSPLLTGSRASSFSVSSPPPPVPSLFVCLDVEHPALP